MCVCVCVGMCLRDRIRESSTVAGQAVLNTIPGLECAAEAQQACSTKSITKFTYMKLHPSAKRKESEGLAHDCKDGWNGSFSTGSQNM